MNIVSLIFRTVFQIQTINKTFDQLIQDAQRSGQTIDTYLADKVDTPRNREQMRHVIGIERWGQRRLRTVLGEPPTQDEYEDHQPAPTLELAAMRDEFRATRATTIELAQEIQQRGIAETTTANHNAFGDISPKLWLRYLTMHANFESKRVK